MLEPSGQRRSLPFNELAAERLREAATLLAYQDDNAYRVAAYRQAADAVAALDTDLRELLEAGGITALENIPGIGQRIAGGLAELARTGRWTYLERLRGSAEPRDIFCAIPGVGPVLAKRLHETLHVETLEQLEAAVHERRAKAVAGVGPRRMAILRAGLSQMLARIRPMRTGPADEPPVAALLDVDREYRAKVQANQLRKIAPRRFNPKGDAWLPILHTSRDKWHFTALFQIPPAPMSSIRCGTGSFCIFSLTAAARRSAPSSRKRVGFLPGNGWCVVGSANVFPSMSVSHRR